jgi:hypothetical protein
MMIEWIFMLCELAGQLELEVSVQSQMLSKKDAELLAVKEEVPSVFSLGFLSKLVS